MARRLHQTLADYLVIAISPALIMALVGSLMFFLLRVFYQGDFQERLHWVMACFVFAAVLIARISIEDGFERAAPFGAALAILIGIAANRFMEYHGTWIDDYSWIINFSIIGLVWWCIHQLTWDCTVIDDDQDASGEGLMQVVGLERPADSRNDSDHPAKANSEPEGTTSREVPASFWQRYLQKQHRPHTPGVWVVYFSLAALPIFGIGQWFIPASDVGGRRYVFWLLGIYVASGLALLVTTSFLGLRRYLRQRRIEMPTSMANLWLATGGAIIAALLVAAALLPRPSAEYAISRLPISVGSPQQKSSRHAPLERNGTKDDEPNSRAASDSRGESGEDPPPDGGGNTPDGETPGDKSTSAEQFGEKSAEQSTGDSRQSAGKAGESSKGGASSAQQKSGSPQGKAKPGNDGERSETARNQNEPNAKSSEREQQPDAAEKSEPSSSKSPLQNLKQFRERERELAAKYEDKPPEQQPDPPDEAADQAEPDEAESTDIPPIEAPLGPLATILQYAFYAVVLIGIALAVWFYWREILAGVRNFLAEFAAWWRNLWGGSRLAAAAGEEVLDLRIPPPPFATFQNPFATGAAGKMTTEELVRYSFDAFEAWSREHGCERELDQTPHELARDVSRLNAFMATDARNLAELYVRAAFAKGQLPAAAPEQLQALWRQMTRSLSVTS